MAFPIPAAYHANQAVEKLEAASAKVFCCAHDGYSDDERAAHWEDATGHLQDALAELGFDLVPLRKQPPATPEALTEHDAPLYQYRGEF